MAGGIRPDADHQAKRAYLGDEARLRRLVSAAVGNIDSSGEDLAIATPPMTRGG